MSTLVKTAAFTNLNSLNEICKSNGVFGSDFLYLTKDNGTITFNFTQILAGYETELDIVIAAYTDPADQHSDDLQVSVHMAIVDPTVNDDVETGYQPACCHWFNEVNSKYYICKVSTAGAAVWALVTFL